MPPTSAPSIKLTHGQVLWLLTELGYSAGVRKSTFYEYIKSLRKFGIPFARGSFRFKRSASYSYCNVMELAITLSLRLYHVVPDSVLGKIIRHRALLHRLYRKAYAHRSTGPGSPISFTTAARGPIELEGLFLDLNIRFSGGQLIGFGPARLLAPADALMVFAQRIRSGKTFLPFSVSALSEQVVLLALRAPTIRRGPSPKPKMRRSRR
jgi:hypothetical protein